MVQPTLNATVAKKLHPTLVAIPVKYRSLIFTTPPFEPHAIMRRAHGSFFNEEYAFVDAEVESPPESIASDGEGQLELARVKIPLFGHIARFDFVITVQETQRGKADLVDVIAAVVLIRGVILIWIFRVWGWSITVVERSGYSSPGRKRAAASSSLRRCESGSFGRWVSCIWAALAS
jgi:hypothetical protein